MKFLLRALLTACSALLPGSLSAQLSSPNERVADLPVRDASGSYYLFPWAGGMNSCQFGSIDLDMDGVKDLVAFDRVGNRLMTFINKGIEGEIGFEFAPEYAQLFPEMFDWMILADYDLDGKEDIFTYSPGYAGMKVFHNVSIGSVAFVLVADPYLTSFQGAIYTNILVTYADYPGIADVDGDGDLDILTFWGLGSFVEMHKNLSMEKYGNCDSLDYEKTTLCWGHFAESEESNELTLDTCFGWRRQPRLASGTLLPHTGSTFLVIDLDGDQVKDVILGDVDYPNLIALNNSGTTDSAHIGSFDRYFPSYDRSIMLYSMPAATLFDVDNNGTDDLLVTPFDPNPFIGENKFSTWLYHNTGSSQVPYFVFNRSDFLQENMIDVGAGSYPVLADYNGDGLEDLFIGNYGYYDSSYMDQYLILHTVHTGKIALYQNIGTAGQPEFTFITDDFTGISELGKRGIIPSFGDLDDDGDRDMVIGYEDGCMALYENVAGAGQPMDMQLITMIYEGIDVGDYSAPQLFDLDGDGRLDMVVGERGGNINFFEGFPGNPWMEFSLVTDSLGRINVTDPNLSIYGFSVPHFFSDDSDNTLLLVGSEQGELYFFTGIDGNLSGKYVQSDTLGEVFGVPGLKADVGYRSAAAVADVNQDGVPDLFAGNFSGGLEFVSLKNSPPVSGIREKEDLDGLVQLFPNPARDKITVKVAENGGHSLQGVRIIDGMGSVIQMAQVRLVSDIVLDLDDIPQGIYLVEIRLKGRGGNQAMIYKKLILF